MRVKRCYSAIVALVLLAIGVVGTAWSYDDDTHRALNEGAVDRSSLNDHLVQALGFPEGINTVFKDKDGNSRRVREWIREGGVFEDIPVRRAANHFHYPLREWDRALLTDAPGSFCAVESSILWAQNPDQRPACFARAETWSWIRARQEFRAALRKVDPKDREEAFANTFRALGQVLHLVADGSVPAHARNDSHFIGEPFVGEPFEAWVEGQARRRQGELTDEQARARFLAEFVPISEHFSPSILGTQPNPLAPIPIAKVFDVDVYDGTSATLAVTGGLAVGITEVANANFFSYSTVFADRFAVTNPRFSPFPASTAVVVFVDLNNNRRYWRKTSPGVELNHLATVTRLDFFRRLLTGAPPNPLHGGFDPVVHDEYARRLLPRAVGYSASLLDYFFRGTLDFTVSAGAGGQSVLRITNTSSETMQGKFTLHADKFSDVRSKVSGAFFDPLTLGPKKKSPELTFTPPSEVKSYILVFEGRLGNLDPGGAVEDGAVAGRVKPVPTITSIEPPTSGFAGDLATLVGQGFDPSDPANNIINFAGLAIPAQTVDPAGTMLTFIVPDTPPPGPVTITSLNPSVPPVQGGTLTISGTNFVGAPAPLTVTVGGSTSDAISYSSGGASRVMVTVLTQFDTPFFFNLANSGVFPLLATVTSSTSATVSIPPLFSLAPPPDPAAIFKGKSIIGRGFRVGFTRIRVKLYDGSLSNIIFLSPFPQVTVDDAGLFLPEAPFIRPPPEPIQFGQTISKAVNQPRVIHSFEFQGQAGQTITIKVDGQDGFDPEIVFDAGSLGTLFDEDSGPGLDAVLSDVTLAESGTFTIEVRSSFDTGFRTTGRFSISLEEAVP